MFPCRRRPRVRLHAPSALFTPKPRRYRASSVDPKAAPPGPSLELSYPSAFGSLKDPFFHFPFRESVWRGRHLLQRSHPQGLATLSVNVKTFKPWKPFSASHALGLNPSKLCSSTAIEKAFPPFLSALALSPETSSASGRRLERLSPAMEAVPLVSRMD